MIANQAANGAEKLPMYFFEVQQADGVITDDTVGTDLKNDALARSEADRALSEMAQDALLEPGVKAIRISVRDEDGRVIAVRSAEFASEDFDT